MGTEKKGEPALKILLTNDARTIAGGENYVLYLADGLSAKGHEIFIAPLAGSELEKVSREKGYETVGIPYAAHGREFNAIRVIVKAFKGKGIDIVHTNSNLDRTIAAAAGKFIGAKNISTIHSCLSINRNIIHWYRNKYLINHFTPVGHSTRKIMIETDNILPQKITVVHIGIPEEKIRSSEGGRRRVRNEFHISESNILLGTLSRLVEFKGHRFLLKAFKELVEKGYNDARLMIVGEGELKESLISLAGKYNIHDKVIFTGARNDVQNVLSAFDIFTQFSIDAGGETFPVAIIEALSAGLPVVGSRVGDIEYLINNNKNGFLVEPENIAQFKQGISNLINSRDLRRDMGKASREKFLSEFTLDKMINNMEIVYRKAVSEK